MTEVDVIVIGGGPAGFGAAMGAASQGASVYLVERHPVLGGMGTAGLVNNFCGAHYDGERFIIGGVFGRLREGLIERRALFANRHMEAFNPDAYAEEMKESCVRVGVNLALGSNVTEMRFGENATEFTLDANRRLRARTVVDATGDAILALKGGVPSRMGRSQDGAVMPLTFCYSLGPVDLEKAFQARPEFHYQDPISGVSYLWITGCLEEEVLEARREKLISIQREHVACVMSIPKRETEVTVNFGRVFIKDPTDPAQLAEAEKVGRQQVDEGITFFRKYVPGFENVKLMELARQIGVRQSRQIEGLYTLTQEDVLGYRQFDDVIAQCHYPIDIHEPNSSATTFVRLAKGCHYDIPLRCLIPKSGPSNLIVAGRAISATPEAMSSFRVSPSVMAIGEAAGVTAALAVKRRCAMASVPSREVQQSLLRHGAILS